MSATLPPLPDTEWALHMPARRWEPAWTSSQRGFDEDQMHAYGAACAAAEREVCAQVCDDVAAQHGQANNTHAEYGADTCAGAIRARKDTHE